jgi:beta-galactosidase
VVTNLRHSADTSDLRFTGLDGPVPVLAPGESARVPLPRFANAWLTIEAVLAAATAWAPEGHVVASAQPDRTAPRPVPAVRPLSGWRPVDGPLTLGIAEFTDGSLVGLGGRTVTGPLLELFRAPTDNDEGTSGNPDESDASIAGVSSASLWRRDGLDRLTTRRISAERTGDALRTLARVAAANSARSVLVETVWSLDGNDLDLRVEIQPSTGWHSVWPRIGIRFDLPDAAAPVDGVSWLGLGPHESYPDSRRAARLGRYTADIGELSVEYARPQETGHRSEMRELTLTSAGDEVLHVETIPDTRGRRPGFTLSRHTPQQIAVARHPFELPRSSTSYLFIDAAQHGLGSRACGPDVWPEYALRPQARTIRLRLRSPGPAGSRLRG